MELVVGTHCSHLNNKHKHFRLCKSLLDNFWEVNHFMLSESLMMYFHSNVIY